jgi:hypothetical protein
MIKGDVPSFVIGDEMRDAIAFVIKGEAPRQAHASFTCIIGDTQHDRASPFCQRSGSILDINLTVMYQKPAHLLFTLHRVRSAPR